MSFIQMETYTYRPGTPPNPQDWSASQSYQRGEAINEVAQKVGDFFQKADNTEADIDPRPGYVRLKNFAAPELLERTTSTITGFRTPEGELSVTGENSGQYQPTTLDITNGGKTVTMDRPWYLNDRYMATLESLQNNEDGTRTLSGNYYNGQV